MSAPSAASTHHVAETCLLTRCFQNHHSSQRHCRSRHHACRSAPSDILQHTHSDAIKHDPQEAKPRERRLIRCISATLWQSLTFIWQKVTVTSASMYLIGLQSCYFHGKVMISDPDLDYQHRFICHLSSTVISRHTSFQLSVRDQPYSDC